MARMSEPEWAPLTRHLPCGAPAQAPSGLELVTVASGSVLPMLSDNEARAVASSSCGYPCSAYFVDGELSAHLDHH
ncbi:hypothetical protein ZWY2020_032606 [Hordeum vulgare]|nr:hypothetical protein ZWY2020_032606 [Hordeum vulgare]